MSLFDHNRAYCAESLNGCAFTLRQLRDSIHKRMKSGDVKT
jgi:hypothetical protein